jgi:hypothetical protein
MANINHNRPYLRFIDNLRRVLVEADSMNKPVKESKIPATCNKRHILFTENELELCNGFLTAVYNYYECYEDFLENFMKRSGNKDIMLKDAEEVLRMHIRALVTGYIRVKLDNNKDSGLYKFWKLTEKGFGSDGIIPEMIIQEIKDLEKNIDDIFQPASSITC